MVAVVSGSGLGLFNSGAPSGNSQVGSGRDQAFVNSTTGNLVIQSADEVLTRIGLDVAITRTYNSQGQVDGDNDDGWRMGTNRRVHTHTGTFNTFGAFVTKTFGDGSEVVYRYDQPSGLYRSTDGEGAHDFLRFDDQLQWWFWTDGDSRMTESYDGQGVLRGANDVEGNQHTFIYYPDGRLQRVEVSTGQSITFVYNGGNISEVVVQSDGSNQTITRYYYDSLDRLQQVVVDLTYADNFAQTTVNGQGLLEGVQGQSYVTTYTYENTSTRIATISQTDGSRLTFTYQQLGNEWRVHTVTDAENRVTRFEYSDPLVVGAPPPTNAPANLNALDDEITEPVTTDYDVNESLLQPGWTSNLNARIWQQNLTMPAWPTATLLETNNSTAASEPTIAFDASGNGWAVWAQGGDVFARRYTVSNNTWAAAFTVDSRTNTVSTPRVAVDESGNTIVAWVQSNGTAASAYVRRWDAATQTWGAVTPLESDNNAVATAAGSIVVSARGGRAVVAWVQQASSVNSIYASRWTGSAWSTAQLLETASQAASSPDVGVDSAGNVVAVWQQSTGGAASIYMARYRVANDTWTTAALVETTNTAASEPRLAIGADGNGVIAWNQQGAHMRAYDAATETLGTLRQVGSIGTGQVAQSFSVVTDGNGRFLIAYLHTSGGANHSVLALTYNSISQTFSELANVRPQGLAIPTSRSVVARINGDQAAVAWLETDGTRNNLYVSKALGTLWEGLIWSPPSLVETSNNAAAQPAIALDAAGNIAAVWQQSVSSQNSIYVNRFAANQTAGHNIVTGDTWASIAARVYLVGSLDEVAAGAALQAALGDPPLIAGNRLTGFPMQIFYTREVPDWYGIPANATWRSIAATLYGVDSDAAGLELQSYFPNLQLVENNTMFGPPATLSVTDDVTTQVDPYYTVTGTSTWTNIVLAVYGTDDAAAVQRFTEIVGGSLTVGRRITVPLTLTYVAGGATGDTMYRRTDVYDAANLATTYLKDNEGRVTHIQAPAVNGVRPETRYEYDPTTGDITRITVENGVQDRVTDFRYDARGNLRLTRDSVGNTIEREYDGNNQLIRVTQFVGADPDAIDSGATPTQPLTSRYVYGINNRLRFEISATGVVTEHRYNASGLREATLQYADVEYSGSTFTETALNGWLSGGGRDLTKTQRTNFTYDARGNLFESRAFTAADSAGVGAGTPSITRFAYDQRGRLLQAIDSRGSATSPDGVTQTLPYATTNVYDGLGRVRETTRWISGGQARRVVESTIYEDASRRMVTTFANGLVKTTTFNLAGEVINVADGPGNYGTTDYTYDTRGRLRVVRDPTGATGYDFYDDHGRKIGAVDGDGSVTEFVYNLADDLVKAVRYARRLSQSRLDALVSGWNSTLFDTLRSEANTASAENQVSRVVYDASGAIVFTIDPAGFATRQQRDGAGRLIGTIEYAAAATLNSTADVLVPGDVVVNETHTDNRRTRTLYNAAGRVIATLDAGGFVTELTYDSAGQLVRKTSYATATTAASPYTADLELLRPTRDESQTDGDAADILCRYFYDGQGRLIGELDGEGHFTETVYDATGQVDRTYRYAHQFAYVAADNPTFTDLRNPVVGTAAKTLRFEYDGAGKVTRITESMGTAAAPQGVVHTTHRYDAAGQLVEATRAAESSEARTVAVRYDSLGRVSAELSATGYALLTPGLPAADVERIWTDYGVTYSYDNANRRISETRREEGTTQLLRTLFFYDRDGRLQFEVDPRGQVNETVYDAFGQVTDAIEHYVALPSVVLGGLTGGLATDSLAATLRGTASAAVDGFKHFEYNTRGLLRLATTAAGNRTEYTHTAFGEIETTTQRQSATSSLVTRSFYDKRGQLEHTQQDPAGLLPLERREYDAFGRTTAIFDARGNVSRFEHDRLGRKIATVDALTGRRTTTYDAFSRVTETTDATAQHNITRYFYVDDTRRVTVVTPEGVSVATEYTRHGEVLRVTTAAGTASEATTTYGYDENGQLESVSDSMGTLESRTYDSLGRQATATDASNTLTRFRYDASSRLLTRTVDDQATGLRLATSYAYDPNTRILEVTEPGGLVTRTEYDVDGRVRYVTVDPNGANRSRTEYQYDDANNVVLTIEGQLASDTRLRYTRNYYDKFNRLSLKIVDGSDSGSATPLNLMTQFYYDAAGNLTKKVDARGYSTWYVYDAGNRLRQTVNAYGEVTELGYDAEDRVVETRRFANTVVTNNFQEVIPFQAPTISAQDRVSRSVYDIDGRERFTISTSSAEVVNGVVVSERGVVTERTFDARGNVTGTRVYAQDIAIPSVVSTSTIAVSAGGNDRYQQTFYDTRDRAVFLVDVYRNVTRQWFDNAGNLVRSTQYAGAPTLAEIPTLTAAALESWTNGRDGNPALADRTTRFWFDSLGRVRFALDAEGYLKETRYSDATREEISVAYFNRPTSLNVNGDTAHVAQRAAAAVESQRDHITTTLRDAVGRVERVSQFLKLANDGVLPVTVYEAFTYDGVGNKRTYRNTNGDVWTYVYDANGRLKDEISPAVSVTSVSDINGTLTPSSESVSIITRMEYDNLGNVRTRTEGIQRRANGTEITAGSRQTLYTYDALGRQIGVFHPSVMVYSAPANDEQNIGTGTQLQETLANPFSSVTYNTLGDAVMSVDIAGGRSRKAYDNLGRVTWEVDAMRQVTEYRYDVFGNVETLRRYADPIGPTALPADEAWSEAQIAAATDEGAALNREITTFYDRMNRRTRVLQPEALAYNTATGAANTHNVNARGETAFVYNAFGEIERESKLLNYDTSDYAHTDYFYDKEGRRRFSVNDLGFVTEDRYDANGNVIDHIEYAKALAPATTWNPQLAVDAPTNHLTVPGYEFGYDRWTSYQYDSLNRVRIQTLHEVEFATYAGANTQTDFGDQVTRFAYDAVGNRTAVTDHYDATTYTYYDALGRIRAIAEPARAADITGDYFTENDVVPLTELRRDAYGNLVEQVRYGNSATNVSASGFTAPMGGPVQWNRMVLDNYGHAKRSQDATLANKYASYNVRGDVAKEWQIFRDVDNKQYVHSVIRKYDALGREIEMIEPQRRNDTDFTAPASWNMTANSDWMSDPSPNGGQWIYWNEVFANWEPLATSDQVWVYLSYTRAQPGGGQAGDTHSQSMYVAGNAGTAQFYWTDANPQFPPATNGSIWSIQRVQVFGRNPVNNQYTVLLRDSQESQIPTATSNTQVAYQQTRYNAFGEMTERGVHGAHVADDAALPEYWKYDNAGNVWLSNAEGGVDTAYLYDVAGRATVKVTSQTDGYVRAFANPSAAIATANTMRTESVYNAIDQVTVQRLPSFEMDDRLDVAAPSVTISLVNGVPMVTWAGSIEPGLLNTFEFRRDATPTLPFMTRNIVQVSAGVLGVDVSGLLDNELYRFQISKKGTLNFSAFARSYGTFRVDTGNIVAFTIEHAPASANNHVETPVIGTGAPASVGYTIVNSATLMQPHPSVTPFWAAPNIIDLTWSDIGSTRVRVRINYITKPRGSDPGNGAFREFVGTYATGGRFQWDPQATAWLEGVATILSVNVHTVDANDVNVDLIRSTSLSSTAGPVRLRWDAPEDTSTQAWFYYKRVDADPPNWSVGLQAPRVNGQFEIDINALLLDDTLYDFRIEHWQSGTGTLLAAKEGRIDSSGLIVNRWVEGNVTNDALTGVFDQYVPVPEVDGQGLRWADPGAGVDVEFRWGTNGSGTYPNPITPSRGSYARVDLSTGVPHTNTYGYQIVYRIGGRIVSRQTGTFSLSAPQTIITKTAAIAVTVTPTPPAAQAIGTISGSNRVLPLTYQILNDSDYIRPNPFDQNYGLWVGPNILRISNPGGTTSLPVRIFISYQLKDRTGAASTANVPLSSAVITNNPATFDLQWATAEQATNGGIYQVHWVQVWSVDGNGNQVSLLKDSRGTGTAGPPTISWAVPADTTLIPRFYFAGSVQRDVYRNGNVDYVDLTGLGSGTFNYEVHYFRPGDSVSVTYATGSFTTDMASITLNGSQTNVVRDAEYIGVTASNNAVRWSRAPEAGSTVTFEYFDVIWYSRPAVTTDGVNYSVDMSFLPNGTFNLPYRINYRRSGQTWPYVRSNGSLAITVTTTQQDNAPVVSRNPSPSQEKWPTVQITGVTRSGNQITWSHLRQSGDRVFFRYRINGGSIIELEQTGSGPAFAVTIPELATDGTKNIQWWVEYRIGSPGSAHAAANGGGALIVQSTTTYPVSTLMTAFDVFPTAAHISAPYQVGGAGNVVRWDTVPEAGSIVEFSVNGVVIPGVSADGRQIDLSAYSGWIDYVITYRRPSQSGPYARGAGRMNIGRTLSYDALAASLVTPPANPVASPWQGAQQDRWGNTIRFRGTDGQETRYRYNVSGALAETRLPFANVLDTRPEIQYLVDITGDGVFDTGGGDRILVNYYDRVGRQVAKRDENGNVNGVTYNTAGQVTEEWHALGGPKRFVYDGFGRQTQVTDEMGWRKQFTYDLANRQTSLITEAWIDDWMTRTFTYDELGRRRTETSGALAADGTPETTTYYYDLVGNLIRMRSELGYDTRYKYDVNNHKTYERNPLGATLRFQYDDFGRVTAKWDLGSVRTDFDYDGTGALDYQQSGHGQRLDYQYDAGGNLAAILDQAENRQAYYGYDAAGRRWRERMYVNGVLHQDAQTTFDAAGRIQQVSDLRYRLNYRYDAHGNRTLIHAVYLNHELASKTDVLLYKYDEMNRVTLSQGVYNSESGMIGATLNQGIVLGYDDLGQRTSASGPGDNGQYHYDGAGRLREIWAGATRLERREYDGASRMKYQIKYTGTPADPPNRTEYIYDDDGRLIAQEVRYNPDGSGARKSRTDFYLDAAGTQTGYYMQTFRNSNGVESVWEWYQYANQYKAADTYLLTVQQVNIQFRQEDGDPDRAYGSLERVYDVNNDVVKLYDSRAQAGRQNRHLANNMQGQAITSIEGDFADEAAVTAAFGRATAGNVNDMRAQHFFHFDGQYLGSFGQLNSTSASSPSNEFKANFDVNYTPVSGQYPPSSTSDIVVQEGDTLRKVAARIFGDPGLWYLLAEENGLTDPDAVLQPGSTIRVPTSVYSLSNTSDVFKPFSLDDAIGDKQASFIDTTPPRPDNRCGKIGQIILTIIAIVVTIIVAYYLGPAAGPVAAFFQGVIAGAAGSIVSQGIGVATGLQESFNWNAVAMSALAGGVGASVAPALSSMGVTNTLANGFVSGAIGNAITQGASIALGLQERFSWRDVALSAAAGAASAQMGKWTSSGANAGKSFAGDFGRGLASGLASSVVRATFGGKFDAISIVTDAFGTALGNSIVKNLHGPTKPADVAAGHKPAATAAADDELNEVLVTAGRRADDLTVNPKRGVVEIEPITSPDEQMEEIVVSATREVDVKASDMPNFADPSRTMRWQARKSGETPQPLAVVDIPGGRRFIYLDGHVDVRAGNRGEFVPKKLSTEMELTGGAFGGLNARLDTLAAAGGKTEEQLLISQFLGEVGQKIANRDMATIDAVMNSELNAWLNDRGNESAASHLRMLAYIKDPENPWLQVPDLGKTLMDFQLTSLSGAGGIGVGNLAFAGLRRLGASIWIAGPLAGVAGDGAVQAIDNAIYASTEGVYGRHGVDWIELGASAALGLAPGVGRAIGKWMDAVGDAWSTFKAGRPGRAPGAGVADDVAEAEIAAASGAKPPIRNLEVVTYGESVEREVVGDMLTGDHMASYAAIRKNVEGTLGHSLSREEAVALRDNTHTVVISDDLHRAGRTYFRANNRAQIDMDAQDLYAASLRDQEVHLRNATRYGYNPDDLRQSFDVLNQRNRVLFNQLSTKEGIENYFRNLGVR